MGLRSGSALGLGLGLGLGSALTLTLTPTYPGGGGGDRQAADAPAGRGPGRGQVLGPSRSALVGMLSPPTGAPAVQLTSAKAQRSTRVGVGVGGGGRQPRVKDYRLVVGVPDSADPTPLHLARGRRARPAAAAASPTRSCARSSTRSTPAATARSALPSSRSPSGRSTPRRTTSTRPSSKVATRRCACGTSHGALCAHFCA